jgi:hypothetical protein
VALQKRVNQLRFPFAYLLTQSIMRTDRVLDAIGVIWRASIVVGDYEAFHYAFPSNS